MKDAEFAKEIQTIIDRNMQQPERLNARLKLRLEDCCKADKKVDYLYDAEEWGRIPVAASTAASSAASLIREWASGPWHCPERWSLRRIYPSAI